MQQKEQQKKLREKEKQKSININKIMLITESKFNYKKMCL